MAFNPLNIFKEKIKPKAMPARGPGGKFISNKPKKTELIKEEQPEEESPTGPFPITFYGHEIRRYYYKGEWYFSLDDVAKTAYLNSDDPTIRKGNPEKISENKRRYALKFDGVEVAKPNDLINFVPYFKGNMPGPITSWLSENSNLPLPITDELKNGK